MPEQFVQETCVHAPGFGHPAVPVVPLLALSNRMDNSVDQHIPRAGIKGQQILFCGTGRQVGEVGNPADIMHGDRTAGLLKQKRMHIGNERRPLSAQRHVCRPKVGYRRNASPLRNDGRVSGLEG